MYTGNVTEWVSDGWMGASAGRDTQYTKQSDQIRDVSTIARWEIAVALTARGHLRPPPCLHYLRDHADIQQA